MKKLFLISMLFSGASALAANIEIFKDATISICSDRLPGCAPYLQTQEGQSYLVDINYVNDFLQKHSQTASKAPHEVVVKEVMGVVVKEKGHMPNPQAEFSVVKIISIIEIAR